MRQRQPQGTANGQPGGDSADAIDGYAAFAQPGHFFAASPKDERVAAFQARHGMALACIAGHESQDEGLRGGSTTAALTHLADTGAGRSQRQNIPANQAIDKPARSIPQHPPSFNPKQ